MRVIVCGSRDWNYRQIISDRLAQLPPGERPGIDDTIIVHGAARGADRIAAQEAEKLGLIVEAHPADWDRYGKRAGLLRNDRMAAAGADLCIAFWDGRSVGTAHMMAAARKYAIPVEIVRKGLS